MPEIPENINVSQQDTNNKSQEQIISDNNKFLEKFSSQDLALANSRKKLLEVSQTGNPHPGMENFVNNYYSQYKKIEPVQSGLVTKPKEDGYGFWNTVADMALSVPQGAANAIENQGNFLEKYIPLGGIQFGDGNSNGELTFQDFIPHIITPEQWKARHDAGNRSIPEFYHPKTLAGGLTTGVSQFITGFIGPSKFVEAAGVPNVTWGLWSLRGSVAGAATDLTVWDPNEGRLADMLVQFDSPILNNAVTRYLASNPNDTDMEARMKNVIEGIFAATGVTAAFKGAVATGKLSAYIGIKAVKEAKAVFTVAEKEAIYKEAGEAIKEVQAGNVDAPIVKLKIAEGNPAINADKIGEAVKIGQETAKQDSESFIKSILNVRSFNSAEHVLHTIDQVSELFTAEQRAYLKDNVLRNDIAEELARTIARDKEELLRILPQISTDANQATVRMLATKMVLQELAMSLKETAIKHLNAFGEDKKLWTNEAREEVVKLGNIIRDSVYSLKEQIRGAARVTQAGNVKVTASGGKRIDVEAVANAVKEFNGDAIAIAKKVANAKTEDIINAVAKTKWQKSVEVFNTSIINSYLSGVATHLVNFKTNLYEALIRPLEQIGGGVVRSDHKSIRLGFAQYQGMMMNFRQTWDAVKLAFKQSDAILDSTMRTQDNLQILGGKAIRSISGANLEVAGRAGTAIDWIGKFIEFPSRLLVASDELFKQMNYRGRLYTNALNNTMERNLNIYSKEGKANIERIIKEGFDDQGRANIKNNPFNEEALKYARESTFTNSIKNGSYLDWGSKIQTFLNAAPELRFLSPFIRTPTNLWRHFENRIPGFGLLTKQMREMWNSGDSRLRSEVIGRQMLGFSAVMYGLSLAMETVTTKDGQELPKLTGNGPSDSNIKKVWMNMGWQPYSIARTNNDGSVTYLQYNRMDPRFYVLGLIADLKENFNNIDEHKKEDIFSAAFLSVYRLTVSKAYLRGLADTLETIANPTENKVSSYFGKLVGSTIPLGGFRDMFESQSYETESFIDNIINKASLGSVLLEPKRDLLTGQPIDKIHAGVFINPEGILSISGITMGPSLVGKAVDVKKDLVMYELARLKVKIVAPNVNKTPDVDLTDYKKNGQSAYDYWIENIGKVKDSTNVNFKDKLDYLFKSDIYKHAQEGGEQTIGGKEFLVNRVYDNYKQLAYDEMLKKYPEAKKAIEDSLNQKAGLMKTMTTNQPNKKSIQ